MRVILRSSSGNAVDIMKEQVRMTDKTAIQIANMKKQTIGVEGVEVEMNGITRQNAARIAAGFFKTERYEFTARRNDYVTWSAWDAQGREWKFQRDCSIRGNDDEKCELVTPILNYEDIETLQGLLRALRKAGARSSASRGCGVHIHVGIKSEAGDHNAQTLTNLANIMAAHEEQIGRAIKIAQSRTYQYWRTAQSVHSALPRNEPARKRPETRQQQAPADGKGFIGEEFKTARMLLLSLEQIKVRTPDAVIVGTGLLKDWRLLFRQFATIKKCKGYSVPVLVWKISKQDEKSLDRYEGYPRFYVKRNLKISVKSLDGLDLGDVTAMVIYYDEEGD